MSAVPLKPVLSVRAMLAVLLALVLACTLVPAAPSQAATEYVVNGDFAKGVEGWKVNKPAVHSLTVGKDGRNRSNAAVIVPSDSQTVVLNDAVDSLRGVAKNSKYTLTAWVRSNAAGAVSMVKAREGSGGATHTHGAQVKLNGTDWQQVTLTFATRFENSSVDVNVLFWGLAPGQKVFVDSVSLQGDAVSPPSPAPTRPVVAPPASQQPSPPKPGTCARTVPTGTMFGTSISTSGQTHAQAVAGIDSLFGRVPIIRVFDGGMVFPWTHSRSSMIAGRDLVMSFRPMPQDVLSGKHDAEFRRWFEQAPSNVKIFWSYIHEPEPLIDQGRFTADQYRKAWQRIESIADSVCRTNMFPTLILTGWTTSPASKRDWRTYYPGADVIDVLAFDPYNGVHDPGRDYYATPESMFDSVVKVAREAGKPYAIAETGSRKIPSDASGSKRAAWLTALANYHRKNGAVFVTYFHSTRDGEWRLLDGPSSNAWRQAIATGR